MIDKLHSPTLVVCFGFMAFEDLHSVRNSNCCEFEWSFTPSSENDGDIYIHNGCFLCEKLDPYDPASPFLTVNNSGCGNR